MSSQAQDLIPVTLVEGLVVDADYIHLLEYPDNIDPRSIDYSVLRFFDDTADGDEKWGIHDLDWHVVSLYVWKNTPFGKRAYVALSEQGHVEIAAAGEDPVIHEHIPDAGFHEEWSKNYGYVNRIREIGTHLYACGDKHQVYRRTDEGRWVHMDQGILVPEAKDMEELRSRKLTALMDIAGLNEESIYTVGYDGVIFYFDGQDWKKVASGLDEDLFKIKIISPEEIYIVGANGTLLKGNHRDGFKNLSAIEDNQRFTGIEIFNNVFYLASNLGLFNYDPGTRKILPCKTNLTPELKDCHVLEAKDGVLWSIGFKDLARFDGHRWERIRHPNNPPIGGGSGTPAKHP